MTVSDMRAEALADGEAAALEAMRTWRLIAQEAFHRLAEQQREIVRLNRQIARLHGGERLVRQIYDDMIEDDFADMEES